MLQLKSFFREMGNFFFGFLVLLLTIVVTAAPVLFTLSLPTTTAPPTLALADIATGDDGSITTFSFLSSSFVSPPMLLSLVK